MNEAFLTTADSAIKLFVDFTKHIPGWKGLEYRAALPMLKSCGENSYPPDMELWTKRSLSRSHLSHAGPLFCSRSQFDLLKIYSRFGSYTLSLFVSYSRLIYNFRKLERFNI